jgi:hypothetical protein
MTRFLDDPIPADVRRIAVLGTTGVGKSTLAARPAEHLHIHHIELDALYWAPGWTASDREVVRARVRAATQAEAWVLDGNYSQLRDLFWPRLQAVVWLDYSLPVILVRLFRRTWQRTTTRELLWGTNYERFWPQFFSPDSLFLWALKSYRRHKKKYAGLLARPENSTLLAYRFVTPRETDAWLRKMITEAR